MPGRPLTRRTAVGTALVTPVLLAGCDIDPPARDGAAPATAPPPEDSALVASVVAALVLSRSVIEAATLSAPDLTPRLEPLATAHAAHLDVLLGAVPDAATTPSAPPVVTAPAALAAVRRAEQRLLREVRRGCVDAASGDLARVLASIVASTAQHAAALADGARA
ncbi:hypothetical protein F4692_003994 [Nocardioides cavernae]|uniref:DUF4439 domain-containing protein n=1 Tax=Nocardioides cavernae TaxID=1921566 RepID=A0A7Y9H6J2_9ACTN|nr:hypothetical protein [Nocardioides cavernae]NYE38839.1 hypothetical protein [Nocardioides cavernae]